MNEKKYVLRIKPERYEKLQAIAKEKGISVNRLINALIGQFLKRQKDKYD